MKLWSSPYSLKAKKRQNRMSFTDRKGLLLKIEFEDGKIGFGAVQPWPEFGDPSLEELTDELQTKEFGPFLQRSIEIARDVAERGFAEQGTNKIKSHLLIGPDDDFPSSPKNSHIKVKFSKDIPKRTQQLINWLEGLSERPKLRLDFNEVFSRQEFEVWLEKYSNFFKNDLDYIEDPCPYDDKSWDEIQKKYSICLAYDRALVKPGSRWNSFGVLIVKPSVQSVEDFEKTISENSLRVVFSSNMDHPILTIYARQVAENYYSNHPAKVEVCGLETNHIFENIFGFESLAQPRKSYYETLRKIAWSEVSCQF